MRTEIWIALPAIGMIAAALTRLTCGCAHMPSVGSLIPGTVTTTTTTTTTTQPASAYRITRVTASGIWWTGPNMPSTWGERSAEDVRDPDDAAMIARAGGPCCGEVHLRSSKGRAKFDHLRRDTKERDWKNIHDGYGSWREWGEPADGEACELWACNYARTEWVLIGGFRWVR